MPHTDDDDRRKEQMNIYSNDKIVRESKARFARNIALIGVGLILFVVCVIIVMGIIFTYAK